MTGCLWSFFFFFLLLLEFSTPKIQQFVNWSSSLPNPALGSLWGFAIVSCNSLILLIYRSNLGGSSLSCALISLRDLRKFCWFFSLFSFLLSRMGLWLLSCLHAGAETGSLPELLITTRPHAFSLLVELNFLLNILVWAMWEATSVLKANVLLF